MHRLSILLAAGLLFSFCKKSDGDGSLSGSGNSGVVAYKTSAQIGAAGGTISDPNGNWTLTIPAGALSQTKTITITTNATATGSVPSDYTNTMATLSFEPHGLTFLSAATLKIKYTQGDMIENGIEEKMQQQYYINDDSKVTAMASTVNAATNEITAQMPHFSFSASLTSSIKKVNNGAITRPSTVRRIANRLIAYFNSLPNDAARNAEFQANAALLNIFIQKLAQILGSDILTAAFPTADFNNNGTPNNADPLIVSGGANVTLTSAGSLFVSANAGATNATQFVWRSSASGTYAIRVNGTNCSDGSLVQSGSVTLNIDNTLSDINASSLTTGDNEYRICVTVGATTTFLLVVIARDEVYPVSSASPAGGTYTTAQNVSMSCLDTGDADCAQVAYTTNGTDPTFDAAGNVTNGTLVTGMWLSSASTTTVLKVRSRDEAGNVGLTAAYNYVAIPVVASTLPEAGAIGVSTGTAITITFSEAMHPATLVANTTTSCSGATLQVSADNFVTCVPMTAASPTLSNGNKTISMVPLNSFPLDSTFLIRVTTGCTNASGIPLSVDYVSSAGFTTGVYQVKDIQTGSLGGVTYPSVFVATSTHVFFAGNTAATGNELWKSDGTAAGTVLVKDINPGSGGSEPSNFLVSGNIIFFIAGDTATGTELWKTDGTSAGTVMVKDIRTGGVGSYPKILGPCGSEICLSADDGINGRELWKTDGTTAGTVLVKDIRTGATGGMPSFPPNDGTVLKPQYATAIGAFLYFQADDGVTGIELWKSDGTNAGTVLVKDIQVGATGSNASVIGNVGATIFLGANDGVNGSELWKSDGTSAGTVLVKDINPGAAHSMISSSIIFNSLLVFGADNGIDGNELWKSDGTTAGTIMIMDINPGNQNSNFSHPIVLGANLYFAANDGVSGYQLWKTDATTVGTTRITDVNSGLGLRPVYPEVFGANIYFRGNDGVNGAEFWRTDGTSAGTVMLKDINPGSASSSPYFIISCANRLFFSAINSTTGLELWAFSP